jgi:hypothetical protein
MPRVERNAGTSRRLRELADLSILRCYSQGVSPEGFTREVGVMKRTGKVAAIVAILSLALVLNGCGMLAQKAAETATGVKVDQSGGKTTVTGPNGQSATVSTDKGQVPQGLPDNVPVYSGTISNSSAVTTPQGNSYQFTVETSDDVNTVLGWYKTQLGSKGWTIEAAATMGSDKQGLVSAKNGTSQLAVTVDASSGKTQIHVVSTTK